MAAFSRLQLAAALLEYDNDPDNPEFSRSAKDSAIFSHLRRGKSHINSVSTADRLGVSVYNDVSSINSGSAGATRKSLASVDAFRNLFASEENEGLEDDGEPDEEFEVDLSSWGLDSFIPKEKNTNSKGKHKLSAGTNSARMKGRTMSLGDIDVIPNPKDDNNNNNLRRSAHYRSHSTYSLKDSMPLEPSNFAMPAGEQSKDSIPFPSSSTDFNGIISKEHAPSDVKSYDMHYRSDGALESPLLTDLPVETQNPFVLRPPSPSRSSRFDPKIGSHNRTLSNATALSTYTANPPSLMAGADRAERTRRISKVSMASQGILDNDNQSFISNDAMNGSKRHFTRLELMRPKILVMPSPLQGTSVSSSPAKTRDGFLVSIDGPPLPPEARTSRPLSTLHPTSIPIVANSFTPNPRLSLSSSQLLFRNSLVVGGQRDVSFNDIDGNISRATVDGEQAQIEQPNMEENILDDEAAEADEDDGKQRRLPGKLYGRSLMDDLEERKANLHNKRRVFTGDNRPLMMNRSSVVRSSTFIDPTALQNKPPFQRASTLLEGQSLQKRGSIGGTFSLNIDGTDASGGTAMETVPRTRSVFGIDTLWERELQKLEKIKAAEEEEAANLKQIEVQMTMKKEKKKGRRKGGKTKNEIHDMSESSIPQVQEGTPQPSYPSLPHVLPEVIRPDVANQFNRSAEVTDDENSEDDIQESPSGVSPRQSGTKGWLSDEDETSGPLRVPGVGPRYPRRPRPMPDNQVDSDEDEPLAATISRLNATSIPRLKVASDSDEDRPLSSFIGLQTKDSSNLKVQPLTVPISNTANEDDDDEPLGLRASKLMSAEDEDDLPLALHPEQQRKTQLLTQQQHMLLQNQFGNAMAFGMHPVLNPYTGFGPPMQPAFSPLALQPSYDIEAPAPDKNKFGRVDRWRRDVAGEEHLTLGSVP